MSQKIAEECGSKYIQNTCDLAIAKLCYAIQSKESPKLDNVFMHLGTFHIECAFYKDIGTFIDGSDLTNVLVDSEIIANGSLKGFLSGKNYNRCKRVHQIMSLSLQKLHFEEFLNAENIIVSEKVTSYLLEFEKKPSENPMINHDKTLLLMEKYQTYTKKTLAGHFGKTAQYHSIYIDMVNLYHILVKSVRTGNLEMYIYALSRIVNFFFLFNHQNYSRLLYYITLLYYFFS